VRRVAVSLLVASLLAAGCGEGEVADDPTTSAPTPTPTTETSTTQVSTTTTEATTTTLGPATDLPAGLFCRDLVSMGYDYEAAVAYWEHEGRPDRMDADVDGIPCETVYPAGDVTAFWGDSAATTWRLVTTTWGVVPGCCGEPEGMGPASPEGAIPEEGWPADGFYWAAATRPSADRPELTVEVRRWVSCDDLGDECPPDADLVDDAVGPDSGSAVTRRLDLTDPDLTVVVVPIGGANPDGTFEALIGSGADFAALLEELDAAFTEWVIDPYEAGTPLADIEADLEARSADPAFPFGIEPFYGYPLAYRGPLNTYLVAAPSWMIAGEGEPPWPPGYNGLYGWRTTSLAIRDGKPVLMLWAGQIAG
jgi:hypothetical protein